MTRHERGRSWRGLFAVTGLVVSLGIVAPVAGNPAEIEGVTFSDSHQAGSIMMPLRGVGLAKFLRTVKVYAGALYLASGTASGNALDDVPKRLELSYFRALKAGDFGQAAMKVLADNVSPARIATLRPRIEQMHRLYEDVKPGDRYGLTYLPGIGTELALNGERKGLVEGADFAAAYFAIWLGPNPINEALKEGLLHGWERGEAEQSGRPIRS